MNIGNCLLLPARGEGGVAAEQGSSMASQLCLFLKFKFKTIGQFMFQIFGQYMFQTFRQFMFQTFGQLFQTFGQYMFQTFGQYMLQTYGQYMLQTYGQYMFQTFGRNKWWWSHLVAVDVEMKTVVGEPLVRKSAFGQI